MKKMIFGILSFLLFAVPVMADDDKPIKVEQMPVAAQQFMAEHFPGQSVAVAKQEGSFVEKNYDVIFTNGNKLEFDRKGVWTNVDCRYGQVPQENNTGSNSRICEKSFSRQQSEKNRERKQTL